jgi:hypothetical protein
MGTHDRTRRRAPARDPAQVERALGLDEDGDERKAKALIEDELRRAVYGLVADEDEQGGS